jgi:uncharacterized protein YjbI with pentapeptide repeats
VLAAGAFNRNFRRRFGHDVAAVLRWPPRLLTRLRSRPQEAAPKRDQGNLRWLRWPLIGLLGVALILLLLWALVTIPAELLGVDQVLVVRKIQDPGKQLDEVNGLRSTLAAVLAGLAVAAGAIVGALNFRETSRQNRAVVELQRRGQVTERFTRAIEQLGDDKITIRIGAVYALEQIARDSAELHWPIMEVLTAYLREHARPRQSISAPGTDESEAQDTGQSLAGDIQAIATVIGRRQYKQDPDGRHLHLAQVQLPGVDMPRANLERADLTMANLDGAWLRGAQLRAARLSGARLNGAHLDHACLEGADLAEAQLTRASLSGARMTSTDLHGAQLTEADISRAQLEKAHLRETQMQGADLHEAHLERADLFGAQLAGARLFRAHLEDAYLLEARLEGVDFGWAQLKGATFRGAHVAGADFESCDLAEAVGLTWAQLREARNVDLARVPASLRQEAEREADAGTGTGEDGRGTGAGD